MERQNSALDPRLVDIDDTDRANRPDFNSTTNKTLTRKGSSLHCLSPKNEPGMDTTTNCPSGGHCKPLALSWTGKNFHPPGRSALLNPISPKRRKGRRLSGTSDATMMQSTPTNNKDGSGDCGNCDELKANIFDNSLIEAFNYLKKACEEKMVSTFGF